MSPARSTRNRPGSGSARRLAAAKSCRPRVGNFLLLPIYVHFLSPADFGSIALVTSVSSLLAIGFRLGLDGSLMRLCFTSGDPRHQNRLLTTVATVTTIAAAIGAGLTACLSWRFFAQLFAG